MEGRKEGRKEGKKERKKERDKQDDSMPASVYNQNRDFVYKKGLVLYQI